MVLRERLVRPYACYLFPLVLRQRHPLLKTCLNLIYSKFTLLLRQNDWYSCVIKSYREDAAVKRPPIGGPSVRLTDSVAPVNSTEG